MVEPGLQIQSTFDSTLRVLDNFFALKVLNFVTVSSLDCVLCGKKNSQLFLHSRLFKRRISTRTWVTLLCFNGKMIVKEKDCRLYHRDAFLNIQFNSKVIYWNAFQQ